MKYLTSSLIALAFAATAAQAQAQDSAPPPPDQNAAQPDAAANYLYFVASCNQPGTHNFATTNEEFLKFEQEYLNCPKP